MEKVVDKFIFLFFVFQFSNFLKKIEVIRLENEVVIFEIVFKMVHGQPYKGFQKIPLIPILITHHSNIFPSRIKII